MRGHEPQAVWADNSHPALGCLLPNAVLENKAFASDFLESGRQDNGPFDSRLGTFPNQSRDAGSRSRYYSQIDRARDGVHAREGRQGENRGRLWIHRVYGARECAKILHYRAANTSRPFRGPNDSNALGLEHKVERSLRMRLRAAFVVRAVGGVRIVCLGHHGELKPEWKYWQTEQTVSTSRRATARTKARSSVAQIPWGSLMYCSLAI